MDTKAIGLSEIIEMIFPVFPWMGISKEFPWPGSRLWLDGAFYIQSITFEEFSKLCTHLENAKSDRSLLYSLPQLARPKIQ